MLNPLSTNFQKFKEKEARFMDNHPIVAPVVNATVASLVGWGAGLIPPAQEDVFVSQAIYQRADKNLETVRQACGLLEKLKVKSGDTETEKLADEFIRSSNINPKAGETRELLLYSVADENLCDLRVLLGKDAFKKIAPEVPEQMLLSGESILDINANEKLTKVKKSILEDFSACKKGDKSALAKYSQVIKKAKRTTARNIAVILGASTLIISECYSFIKNGKKISNTFHVEDK